MTKNSVINLKNMKRSNRLLVLAMLRDHGPVSRVDLTRRLKCDGTTITHIIRDLHRENLIVSKGSVNSTGGRPKELLDLNQEAGQIIGISFEPPYISGIVADLRGCIKFCERILLGTNLSSSGLSGLVVNLTKKLFAKTSPERITGIGITTYGVLAPDTKTVITSGFFPSIKGIDFTELFKNKFGLEPIIIDNTLAKAFYEIHFNKKNKSNFLLIDAGFGIACATVLNGSPVTSPTGFIGEFGHSIVNPGGTLCCCGRKGCLEAVASLQTIMNNIEKSLKRKLSFQEIVEMYNSGDKTVTETVNHSAAILGFATGNLLTTFPTDKIILTGQMTDFGKEYFDKFSRAIRDTAFPLFMKNTKILMSEDNEDSAALGACSLILRNFFETGPEL